jgi:hypothetical protein
MRTEIVKTFHETPKKCMHNIILIFLFNFLNHPENWKTYGRGIYINSVSHFHLQWTLKVEHQVYLHPMHITSNRIMIIPALSSQLFYNIKGFRHSVVTFMLFCRNMNGLHVYLTILPFLSPVLNYYIFCTNSCYNS